MIHGSLRRIGAFHVFLEESERFMSSLSSNRSLLDHFSALRDPREGWRVLYPLPEILLLVLCATLSGMEDFVEIRLWGEQRIDFLRRLLPFDRGLPAHDTLNDVVNALDAELFKTLFANWAGSLREAAPDLIAIDGKTSRRSHARAKAVSLCICFPHGRPASASSWVRRLWTGSRTKSSPFPCCSKGSNWPGRWSPSTPWELKWKSRKESSPAAATICWR
jgi:hypothetical protein